MTERENVILGLKCCKESMDITDPICGKCPYKESMADCVQLLAADALALLKAHEPMEPKYDPDDDDWAHCGHCGARLYERWVGANYCAFCGHEVKWDG